MSREKPSEVVINAVAHIREKVRDSEKSGAPYVSLYLTRRSMDALCRYVERMAKKEQG